MRNFNVCHLVHRKATFVMAAALLVLTSCNKQDDTDSLDIPRKGEPTMLEYEQAAQKLYYSEPDTMTQFNIPTSRVSAGQALQLAWMSTIPDVAYLTDITIPGTHNSAADNGNNWVKCQGKSIRDQLNIGIRAFDIRCRHIGDAYALHHNGYFLNKWFGADVRDVFIKFLQEHPSESIIMSVKPEHSESGNTRSFEATMDAYIAGLEKYFYLEEKNPQLKDIRGKIVLLRRFSSNIHPMGNEIKVGNNCFSVSQTTIHASIQDVYNVPTIFDYGYKWNRIRTHLDNARQFWNGTNYNCLYINFMSGTGAGSPWDVANGMLGKWGMNQTMDNHLKQGAWGRFGIIFMDYAGVAFPNIVSYLIWTNNRVLERGQDKKTHYASSEETEGEGPNNGRAIHAFDNNPNTHWHSQWKANEAKFPHSLTMYLGGNRTVNGIRFTHRQNILHGRPRTYYVESSPDGSLWYRVPVPTWSPEYTNANTAKEGVRMIHLYGNGVLQYSFGSPVNGQYIKVTFLTSEDNSAYTYMAEVSVF